jgi:beta-N-acetylhexosaminidase
LSSPRAVIFGCAAETLSAAERDFFTAADPLGFILFARNCHAPDQVRDLVMALRDSVGRRDAPVLIDQEGGRVQRLRPPHWRDAPAALRFGELYVVDPRSACAAARLNARLIAEDLRPLGIDVDCLPVLDLPIKGSHEVISDRAFGSDPARIAALGRAVCEGLMEGGVLPVIKHIPGHGRATVDSHLALPRVSSRRDELETSDFAPFRALKDMPMAMTAHVVYEALDDQAPATTSPFVIEQVIRGDIGFGGLLISDDISMQALSGGLGERTAAALAAGCDVVLHCNGEASEMEAVAEAASVMSPAAAQRFEACRACLGTAFSFDRGDAEEQLARLLEGDADRGQG